MSEIQILFWAALAIAVVESFVRMRRDAVLFVREPLVGAFTRSAARSALFWNDSEGFVFGALTPLGWSFSAPPWPVAFSPEGVASVSPVTPEDRTPGKRRPTFHAFSTMNACIADGRALTIDGTVVQVLQSANHARLVAHFIEKLRRLPEPDRAAAISLAFDKSLDADAARTRMAALDRRTRPLHMLGTLLFFEFFGLLFAAAFLGTIVGTGLWLGGFAILTTAIIGTFIAAHRRERPGETLECVQGVLHLVMPFHTLHAGDLVRKHAMEFFHPLAVAAAVLAPDALAREFEPWLRAERYPRGVNAEDDPRAVHVQENFRTLWRDAFGRFARRHAINGEELLVWRTSEDTAARAFCPRCTMTFAHPVATCADCGARTLVR